MRTSCDTINNVGEYPTSNAQFEGLYFIPTFKRSALSGAPNDGFLPNALMF